MHELSVSHWRFRIMEASVLLGMMAEGTDWVRWHLRHWARRIEVKREQAVCVNLSEHCASSQ